MLVLSRKKNEGVLIGENIVVTVVRIGQDVVRLGIDAPRDQNIVREELVIADRDVSEPRPANLAELAAGQADVYHQER